MALETATYISGLVATNPAEGDNVGAGNDHLWLLKSTLLNTFPNITGAVTATHTQLNYSVGVTSAIQTQLDAKASATAAGRWTQLGATKTISGDSTLDFASGGGYTINSTYELYRLQLVKVLTGTDAVDIFLRTSTDGGSTYNASSGYDWTAGIITAGTVTGNSASATNQINVTAARTAGTASNELGVSGDIYIWMPSNSTHCEITWEVLFKDASAALTKVSGVGARIAAADVDALRLICSSGNFNTGTVRLYGLIK